MLLQISATIILVEEIFPIEEVPKGNGEEEEHGEGESRGTAYP